MENQNYNRYDRTIRRMGVIYKDPADAMEYFNSNLQENEFQTIDRVEYFPDGTIHRVEATWDFTSCKYMPEDSRNTVQRSLHSFHKMIHDRDAHNVAGMQFRGFYFCDSFSKSILNYLMSRIRG